jgi:hypothetical protein
MDSKTNMWQLIATVSLIVAVVALIMPFVIPSQEGAEGPQGIPGEDGADGQDGVDGNTGPQGDIGPQGLQGPAGSQGLPGTNGSDGIACWDLNENGQMDIATEDINGDLVVNVADCTGLTGSTGLQGPIGPPGPGTVMAWSVGNATDVSTSCTQLLGFNVTIKAPSDGHIVVTSMLHILLYHGPGIPDRMEFKISPVQLDCARCQWTSMNLPTRSTGSNR